MKRMSIAEITLKKQVDKITDWIKLAQEDSYRIHAQIRTMEDMRTGLQHEIETLAAARLAASTSRKP